MIICLGLIPGCTSHTGLKWNQGDGYRWAEVSPDFWGNTGFEELSSSVTNITFENRVGSELVANNRNYLNGSGVAVADVDGDSLPDIYFAGLNTPNKLYTNRGGFRFRDITRLSGLNDKLINSTGAVFADVDGDRDSDLLVSSFKGKNVLYLNDGNGKFSLKEDSGLKQGRGSMTMALADIDSDGDLDLYITNYKEKSVRDMYSERELSLNRTLKVEGDTYKLIPPFDEHYGIIQTESGQTYRNEYGKEDELYINNGAGKFTLADPEEYFFNSDGTSRGLDRDWGLTAKFQDLNGDGHPDLYVCNDFWTPDRVWINRGDGTFELIKRNAIGSYSFSSMGIDFADINSDGYTDIFVTEMLSSVHQRRMRQLSDHIGVLESGPQYNRNSLYLNRGDHTYAEISYYSGLEATEWSWATRFMDVDLDGYEDVLITTGHAYDYQDLDTQINMSNQTNRLQEVQSEILEYPSLELANKALRNEGNLRFTDQSQAWGFSEPDISHGMAVADLDTDGDLELIVNRLNRPAAIYENTTASPRISVRLIGNKPNTQAIGAVIQLKGAGVIQTREVSAGGDYLSGSHPMEVFAAAQENKNHILSITWPDGQSTQLDSIKANRIYEIEQPSAFEKDDEDAGAEVLESKPLFEDVSHRIDHKHHENSYDDFKVSPLLPFKLSQQGPGVTWIDYNRDGKDDLIIASGKGGKMSLFKNKGDGTFGRQTLPALDKKVPGDQTTLLGWMEEGKTVLIGGSANYEQGNPAVPSAVYYEIDANLTIKQNNISGVLSTTGPLAATDYDKDGDIDLFLGGRFIPGQYPVSANSRLFVNNGGSFALDRRNSLKLKETGLVTGAAFTDYNVDGDPDLLLSTEWGSLKLFDNQNGLFREVTKKVGLAKFKGWWNGVATGDFNNDGKPDVIATNIGQNSSYKIDGGHPIRIYYDDFNRDGRLDIVESYMNETIQAYVPKRRLFNFKSHPTIVQQVSSHREYARLSVSEIFNRDFQNVPHKEINTLQHHVFINTDEGFIPRALPPEAQFSAAFAAAVADYDNDGNEDVFLSQNTFAGREKEPRLDAGRGLWLQGDGHGNFRAIPGQKSGIKVYGQQRGAALADFNKDGRVDLAVSQNNGMTKLYENKTSRSGLRIQLIGGPGNRSAIGASIRLVYTDNTKGPRREIQAGTGYWSQNSPVQIMGFEKNIANIEVTWPDGRKQSIRLNKNKTNYLIRK